MTQEAQKRENEVQMTIAQARKDIEEARGDSLSAVIRAAGNAQANKKLNDSLTPQLIDYERIQMLKAKWDGNLPTTTAGDAPMLLNMK